MAFSHYVAYIHRITHYFDHEGGASAMHGNWIKAVRDVDPDVADQAEALGMIDAEPEDRELWLHARLHELTEGN